MTEPHVPEETLLDLALGVSSPDESDAREHLAECSECAEAFGRLEQEQAVLADAFVPGEAPPELVESVLAAVEASPTLLRRRRHATWRLAIAVAAGLLLAATATLLVTDQETPKQELIRQVRVSELKALGLEDGRGGR